MGCLRIYNRNFVEDGIVANKYFSSEQSLYPASNLYNKYRRGKVWRSGGYWDLSSGDYKLVFRESVGVDLIATVVNAEYVTTSTFIAAIKTALDAAGASTYTVVQDTTTNKIKITSDGSGGGGIFQLILTDPDSALLAGVTGFDTAANLTGALTYTADELKIHTSEWLKWDFGIPTNPEAFTILGNRNKPLTLSPSAVIKLQGNETDNWSSPSFEQTLEFNDYTIALQDSAGLHTGPLRYWRMYVEDRANPLGYIEAGYVFLGDAFDATRGAPQFPLQDEIIDQSEAVVSESGQVFFNKKQKYTNISVEWFALTKQEREDLEDIFETFGNSQPLVFSIDANEAFSTEFQSWVKFCFFEGRPQFRLVSPNNFALQMNLREAL